MRRLTAHVARDLQRYPKNLGYMGDGRSRGFNSRASARGAMDLTSGYTTYDGGTNL